MPFTFRPSIGADVVFADGAAGLLGVDLYNEDGSAIVLSRNLFGQTHSFLSGSASVAGTAGTDTLIAHDAAGAPDVLFWDPTTFNQLVSPVDFVTPFTNNAAASIDVVILGAGNDILSLAHDTANLTNPGAYTLGMTGYGGDGQDILWMAAGADVVAGDAGDDLLAGQGGNDTMFGGAGFDTLFGGSGADLLRFDTADISQGANLYQVGVWTGAGANPSFSLSLAGGSGYGWSHDLFDGGVDIDTLRLTNGNDLVVMNAADLRINGVAQTSNGNQLTGVEVIDGQGGNDAIILNNSAGGIVTTSAFSIAGGAGFDLIVAGSGDDFITGGNFTGAMAGGDRDTVFGGGGSDVVYGDSQDDPIDSENGGIDTLYGGTGSDTAYGGAATDTLYGEENRDTLFGGSGDDTAYGGGGIDVLFGDNGNDTLDGGDVDDTLDGGFGLDRLIGGIGNDVLMFSADYDADGQLVVGWDGSSQPPQTVEIIFDPATIATFDSYAGGDATDTVDLRGAAPPGSRLYFGPAAGVPMTSFISGVELIHAGAAADVILLSSYLWEFDEYEAYASNITIIAGQSNDAVFSGSGSDVIYGDYQAGTLSSEDGADTLFGGAGNDTVYGDSVDGQLPGAKAGADTIYGAGGSDVLYGGGNNDELYDVSDGSLYGGDGADLLAVELRGVFATGLTYGGDESEFDGNDRVFISGFYDTATSALGAGNDIFISLATGDNGEGESGARVDRVSGGTGSDVISSWFGNDELYGGDGSDVLWGGDSGGEEGGAIGDVIYGGDGIDYIYPGAGANDHSYGGAGVDYYYWARGDGPGDQIFDELRGTPVDGSVENYIVVYSGFDEMGVMPEGWGVFEADGSIIDNDGDDMVRVYDVDGAGGGTIWRLEILQGAGSSPDPEFPGSYIEFDQRDIAAIGLWNHDAVDGTPVITAYFWNGTTYAPL